MKLKTISRLLLWLFVVILGTLFSSQGSQISKAQANSSTSFGPQYTPAPRYALDRVIVKFKGGQFRLQTLSEVKSQYRPVRPQEGGRKILQALGGKGFVFCKGYIWRKVFCGYPTP